MAANPIKVLTDYFDKVIIEHGSAVIQEKHIALLKEQLGLVEREKINLEKKIEELETVNHKLKKEKDELVTRIESYEKYHRGILHLHQEFGVLWDEELNMYCINCQKRLKYSSRDPSVFHCSDPNCDNKHTLRDK